MAYNPLSTIANAHSFEDEQSITVTFAASTAATYALPAEWYNVASALQIVILYGAGGGMYFVGNPAAKATTPVQFHQTADPTASADQALLSIVAGATPSATNTAHNLTLLKDTDDGSLSLGVTATAAAAAMTVMVRRWVPAVTA